MANNDEIFSYELEALNAILKQFRNGGKDAIDVITKYEKEIRDDIASTEERRKEAHLKRVAELELKGIISNSEEAARITENELARQKRIKLEDEIEIINAISAANKKERDKQNEFLQRELDIVKQKNAAELKAASVNAAERQAAKKTLQEADKLQKKLTKDKAQYEKEQQKEASKQKESDKLASYSFGDLFENTFSEGIDKLYAAVKNPQEAFAQQMETIMLSGLKAISSSIKEGLNEVNNAISSYAKYQTSINTRTQGATSFSTITDNLKSVAFSPLLSAEELYANVSELVSQGIISNVEQRAMFMTVKDSIAQTFDVTSSALNRMIRLQQNDSTAARLGMESYLNRFLNTYVENTEYLTTTFDNVANSLFEASAMLGASSGVNASLEFEYIVQKWLGTLTGLGLSESTAQNLAEAIGQLGSGNIDSLSNSSMQNLLIMGANAANLSYADLLSEGLSASDTNALMQGILTYLNQLSYESSSNVVQSQLANIFGVTVSDLLAAQNVNPSLLSAVSDNKLSYQGMYSELASQFNTITERLGVANILENLFSNITYQTGMNLANNPATYALWKITDFIRSNTGGINIPAIMAMGSGIDLNANVEDIMQMAIMATSMLGNIGNIVNGLSSISNGSVLLEKLGINSGSSQLKIVGEKNPLSRTSGLSATELAYIGNTNSDIYSESAINSASDEANKELDIKMQEQEEDNPALKILSYLEESVDLKSNLISLNEKSAEIYSANVSGFKQISSLLATGFNISSYYDSETSATPASNTNKVGLKAISKDIPGNSNSNASIAFGAKETDLSDYLSNIDFASNFSNLVQNVDKIAQKMDESLKSDSGLNISGLTQFNDD